MARVRRAFDPDGRFNPAKMFPTPVSCGEIRLRQQIFRRGCGFKKTGFESRVSGLGFKNPRLQI